MGNIAENLKKLREDRRWTKKYMAEILGLTSYTTIIKWENGENHPRGKEIKDLCALFNVSADYLLGLEDVNKNERINYYKYYPVAVSAGLLEDLNGVTEAEVSWLPMRDEMMGRYATDNDVFFVNVNGTSMNKIIADGAKIGVKPVNNFKCLKDGDIVLFSKDNEFSIKRFYNYPGMNKMIFRPESTDPSHTDIVINYDDLENVRFYGKVVVNISQFN